VARQRLHGREHRARHAAPLHMPVHRPMMCVARILQRVRRR
jgi:hypothetical protein